MTGKTSCNVLNSEADECRYFEGEGSKCLLLEKMDVANFGLLLNAPCNLLARLKRQGGRITREKGKYIGQNTLEADDLVSDAIVGVLGMLEKNDFPFQSASRSLDDVIGYCVRSMNHALLKYSTIKKLQGRYCIYFADSCTSTAFDSSSGNIPSLGTGGVHHYFGKKDCQSTNPFKMNPPCRNFASPFGQSIFECNGGNSIDGGPIEGMSLSDRLSVGDRCDIEGIDHRKMVVKKWREAGSIPDIRRMVRIVKYTTLAGTCKKEGFNATELARSTGIDVGTVRDDLEKWAAWNVE